MKKYLLIFKTGWQELFEYRLDLVIRRIRSLLVLFTLYFLYTSVFEGQGELFGYDKERILSYVIFSHVVFLAIFNYSMDGIADTIASGNLNQYLLKPINFFLAELFRNLSSSIYRVFFAIVDIFIFSLLVDIKIFTQKDLLTILLALLSLMLAFILFSILDFLIPLTAFWTLHAYGPRFIFKVIFEFASGRFFPLAMLPGFFLKIFNLLPFGFLLFFPINIYFGNVGTKELIMGFATALIWMILGFGLLYKTWKLGTKDYGAYGG